jgi:hypothetical protein
MNKLEGPGRCITFLVSKLDLRAMEIRLPSQKLGELQSLCHTWVGRRSGSKRELESLVGKLAHASTVVPPGKTFLQRMFELLGVARRAEHHIRLGAPFRSDLLWWATFLGAWNGVAMLPAQYSGQPSHQVWTDASGSFGCGAVYPAVHQWIQLQWPHSCGAGAMPLNASMLWAASSMCFFGFLRSGEVVVPSDTGFDPSVHLTYGDVKVDSTTMPRYLEVRTKPSKTDPFHKGVSVFLGKGVGVLCRVSAVLDYLVRRGSVAGPFFFTFADGRPFTRDRFVKAVREAMDQTGINSSLYTGHSFRIGAATTAAQRGVQDSLIKTLGRWESAAYTVYIRTPRETLCAVSRTLVGPLDR